MSGLQNRDHKIQSWIQIIAFATLSISFVLISIWRWEIISSSVISLVLTPIVIFLNEPGLGRFLRSDLWEYWVAAALWLVTFWLITIQIGKRIYHSRRESSGPIPLRLFRVFGGRARGAVRVLGLFVFMALTAPFLAPFSPNAQGDLASTRLLRPLEKGVLTERPGSIPALDPGLDAKSSVGRFLDLANKNLLHRDEKFTRFRGLPMDDAGVPQGKIEFFFLGTDDLGRDVLSRIIYGTRISLGIGFAAMFCAVLLGCFIGFPAGILGGWADRILMRLTDLFLAVPALFLVITLVAFLGNSTWLLILVLGVTGWMGVARLVRGEVLMLREREFILAARLLGRSSIEILWTHMVPNVVPTILLVSILQLGNVVLAEAALSFLGLGIQPPTPSWGNMIGESLAYLRSAWWVGVFPGLALSILLVSANFLAERIEENSGIQR